MAELPFVADQIEKRPVGALVPYARNARLHSAEQVSQIAASMQEFGWTYPVLVDEDDGIIAGHGRVLAAQKLKLVEVPVIVARGWTEEQRRAYIIADNKLAALASWDPAMLKIELADLQGAGFDLSLTGFGSLELTGIFSTQEGRTDPTTFPSRRQPVSVPGDLWRWATTGWSAGTAPTSRRWSRLAGQKPHLMVTDPPYGVNYDPDWRNQALRDGPAARSAAGRLAR
jgi:hypothetical protein